MPRCAVSKGTSTFLIVLNGARVGGVPATRMRLGRGRGGCDALEGRVDGFMRDICDSSLMDGIYVYWISGLCCLVCIVCSMFD